jgi:hypothetical protein
MDGFPKIICMSLEPEGFWKKHIPEQSFAKKQ